MGKLSHRDLPKVIQQVCLTLGPGSSYCPTLPAPPVGSSTQQALLVKGHGGGNRHRQGKGRMRGPGDQRGSTRPGEEEGS